MSWSWSLLFPTGLLSKPRDTLREQSAAFPDMNLSSLIIQVAMYGWKH